MPYRERSFEVILDCTSFTSAAEVPLQWLKYCVELIPSDLRYRFAETHILNPNTLTQRYLRRLYNISAGKLQIYANIFLINEILHQVPPSAGRSRRILASLSLENASTRKLSKGLDTQVFLPFFITEKNTQPIMQLCLRMSRRSLSKKSSLEQCHP